LARQLLSGNLATWPPWGWTLLILAFTLFGDIICPHHNRSQCDRFFNRLSISNGKPCEQPLQHFRHSSNYARSTVAQFPPSLSSKLIAS